MFDLLAGTNGKALTELTLDQRRAALERFAATYFSKDNGVRLSPATTKLSEAKGWLKRVGATLDGIIAKRRDFAYRSGDRTGMQKIKNYRSADCVVGGFRYNTGKDVVGSLLLGLYDADGLLHHVGFTSTIKREEKTALTATPLTERRKRLEDFAAKYFKASDLIRLSPATTRLSEAKGWLKRVGSTLDGIIAKRRDLEYRSDDRSAMQKIKNYRSADCVVGGFRYNEGKKVVGSLLLGLYDDAGLLHHVGFTSTIARKDKPALTERLEALIAPPGFTGNAPGGPSRWSTKRSAEWQPLRPKLVVEVCYDHFSGERFRHGTRLTRWRPDKAPKQCRLDQVKQKKANLMKLLA